MSAKQEINIQLESEFQGTLETFESFKNYFEEDLKIYNFYLSSIFDNISVQDKKNEELSIESIPVNNCHDRFFAVQLKELVPQDKKSGIKIKANLSKQYFDLTTTKNDGLYFWNLRHAPAKKTHLVYSVKLSQAFEIVHVQGMQPKTKTKNQALWDIKIAEHQSFNALVVYKRSV